MLKTVMTGRKVPSDLSPPSNPTNLGSSSDQMEIQSFPNVQSVGHSHTIQILVHKKNGKNYPPWFQSIKLIVRGRGKMGYLTDNLKVPKEEDTRYEK